MAGGTFQKFKSSLNRSVTTISVKASSSLEKTKIRTHIESIQGEIQRLTVSVGEGIYAKWSAGESDYASIVEQLESIKQKNEEIQQLTEEFNSIDDRDSQILGNTKAQETAAPPPEDKNAIFCPKCGARYDSPVRFCRKCGCQLSD